MVNSISRAGRRVSVILFAVVLFVALWVPAQAQAAPTSSEKQAEAQAALISLNAMQSTLEQASNDYYLALDELESAQAACEEAQARIDSATEEIAGLQERLGKRVNRMYRDGSASFLDVLLGATSFNELSYAWDILMSINESDADLVRQTKALREEIASQKAILDEQSQRAAEKTEEARQIQAEAEATVANIQATYDGLSAEAAELLEQERQAQIAAEEAAAQAVVDAAIADAQANQNRSAQAQVESPDQPLEGGAAPDSQDDPSSDQQNSQQAPSFTPSYDAVTGNAIVDRAYGCLGAGYEYNTCGPSTFDCSGLVSYALTGSYTRVGSTYTFMNYPQVSDPQPGDIAVNAEHCGIYIGGGQMIHAATYGVGVITGPVQGGMIFVRP